MYILNFDQREYKKNWMGICIAIQQNCKFKTTEQTKKNTEFRYIISQFNNLVS